MSCYLHSIHLWMYLLNSAPEQLSWFQSCSCSVIKPFRIHMTLHIAHAIMMLFFVTQMHEIYLSSGKNLAPGWCRWVRLWNGKVQVETCNLFWRILNPRMQAMLYCFGCRIPTCLLVALTGAPLCLAQRHTLAKHTRPAMGGGQFLAVMFWMCCLNVFIAHKFHKICIPTGAWNPSQLSKIAWLKYSKWAKEVYLQVVGEFDRSCFGQEICHINLKTLDNL